eukprot:TRINITY_DN39042_c0_g2_i1.p1 TRINITY_DN39042_c0_g2~~TRINITY_DN39042_c0_g2_i1.p1  ORF type:complete len:121 (+),score=28.65 TRINITY_DN39042_c0_g2_i1:45-407(+)
MVFVCCVWKGWWSCPLILLVQHTCVAINTDEPESSSNSTGSNASTSNAGAKNFLAVVGFTIGVLILIGCVSCTIVKWMTQSQDVGSSEPLVIDHSLHLPVEEHDDLEVDDDQESKSLLLN